MLGALLITWKNGRTVKTYGLNHLEKYNMKFTFICIVIVLSCSVCASGDLEIYPGLKFDLSSEEQRRRLENSEEGPLYSDTFRRWPWRSDDYGDNRKKAREIDLELPERLRNLKELLDRNENEMKNEDELPVYYNPRPNFEDAYDEYSLEKTRKYDRYNFRYPNNQILDDVRPYPHEDDFTFGDDEEIEDEVEIKPQHHERDIQNVESKIKFDQKPHVMPMNHGNVDKTDDEDILATGILKNAKFVEDPSQFAYPPSDPRFFQNAEANDGHQKFEPKLDKFKDNKINLNLRSDEAFSDDVQTEADEEQRNDNHVDVVAVRPQLPSSEPTGVYIIAIVAGISAAATVGLIAVGIGWYNLQKHVKNASDVEYPAYGVTGPNKDASPSGDRRLAQSAQMYHYQHQKQQIIAMESRAAAGDRHGSVSEADSDEENEEGDYTVYECPGLAPTGEMEVKNPLFQDDPTPAQTPPVKPNGDEKK